MKTIHKLERYIDEALYSANIFCFYNKKYDTIEIHLKEDNNKVLNNICMFCNNNGLTYSICQNIIVIKNK